MRERRSTSSRKWARSSFSPITYRRSRSASRPTARAISHTPQETGFGIATKRARATVAQMSFTARGTRTAAASPVSLAGLLALVVPAVLGALAVPALVMESPPLLLVALTYVGFPFVVIAGEHGLATGLLSAAMLWAPIVAAIWWTAGRRAARATAQEPPGFTWARWRRNFAVLSVVVLLWQTPGAFLLVGVVMAAMTSLFIGIPVLVVVLAGVLWLSWSGRRSRLTRGWPGQLPDLDQRKQCPRCGEFIRTEVDTCEWCDAELPAGWHHTMP